MALEALFGDDNRATAAVIDGVNDTIGPIDAKRLRALMLIRGSVIHGGAPDVYDSRKYARYYRTFGDDPIRDMGLVVAACLRARIFGGMLGEHSEPHQQMIEQQRALGRMPRASICDGVLERVTGSGASMGNKVVSELDS
jgi:hypothetical protein